jgi:hypothetical protein
MKSPQTMELYIEIYIYYVLLLRVQKQDLFYYFSLSYKEREELHEELHYAEASLMHELQNYF